MPRFAEPVRAPSAKKSASKPAAARPQPRRLRPSQQAALWQVLQLKAAEQAAATSAQAPAAPSRDGLPERLRAGVERLSGLAMGDVRVHRDSPEPARLGALAYTKGSDIHLGPGQERHLPHEAWHVVQQKQDRVKATRQHKRIGINDDPGLEHEADTMGARAATLDLPAAAQRTALPLAADAGRRVSGSAPIQCVIRFANVSSDQKYASKAQSIIDGLQATPSIQQYLQNKNVLITLASDPQLASVRVADDQVQITLSPWFFEQQSRGRILGMLAHEFAVHPVAREALTQQELAQEDQDFNQNIAFPTGIANLDITPQQAGQRDHVFAAVANQPRFLVYRRAVHEMARAMLQRAQGNNPAGTTEAHVTDLIMTYLSDVAMILATNDDRKKIVQEPTWTAQAFNLERTSWLQFLAGLGNDPTDARLIQLTPATKTKWDVLGEVGSIVGSLTLSAFTGSTSGTKMTHAKLPLGGVAETTQIQQEVMQDHNLALAIMQPNARSLFDAIDVAGGFQDSRQDALNYMNQNPNPNAVPVLQLVTANAVINDALSWSTLNIIAWSLRRKLRVLEPNGKLTVFDYGQTLTILRVERPAPHYRAAQ